MRATAVSLADGFMNVKEGVDEMIQTVANEPSVGLFFMQQHAQATIPILFSFQKSVTEKVHEVTLQTEDMEDSVCAVRSMIEHGLIISDAMLKDIKKSLLIMSSHPPKRGLIKNPSWGYEAAKSSSGDTSELRFVGGMSSGQNYLSTMFNSAMQTAAGFKWPQPDFNEAPNTSGDPAVSVTDAALILGSSTNEGEELLPVSIQSFDDVAAPGAADVPALLESYEEFRAEQELKLQGWLQKTDA